MTWLVSNIKLNKLEWFSVVDKGASGDSKHTAKIVLWKRDKPTLAEQVRTLLQKQESAMTIEEILAKLSEEEQKILMDALAVAATPAAPAAPAVVPAPVESAAPEAKPVESAAPVEGDEKKTEMEKRLSDENLELRKRLEAIENKSRMIELTKRAEDLDFLPIATLDLAKILGQAEDSMDDDQHKAFSGMLISINKAMKASPAFKEHGTSQADGEETAIEKRDKLVMELRKEHPRLKEAQARMRVYKANPGLSAEVEAESN